MVRGCCTRATVRTSARGGVLPGAPLTGYGSKHPLPQVTLLFKRYPFGHLFLRWRPWRALHRTTVRTSANGGVLPGAPLTGYGSKHPLPQVTLLFKRYPFGHLFLRWRPWRALHRTTVRTSANGGVLPGAPLTGYGSKHPLPRFPHY